MKPHDTTVVDCHIAFIVKQRMHRNVWMAEDFRAPALWRQDQDVYIYIYQNKAMLLIFQGRLTMFTEESSAANRKRKRDEKYANLKRKI